MAGQVPTGVGLTLRLLPAPTAKVVAAGLGLDLVASHYHPSLCFSSAVPYDDDVFKTAGYAAGQTSDLIHVPAPPTYVARTFARPLGRDAWRLLTGWRNILITIIRNEGVSTLLVLNNYFAQLYEEEERAEREDREPLWPAFPREAMKAAARRGLYNSGIDYTVQCTRALLDSFAVRTLPLGLSVRLTRDLRAVVIGHASTLAWYARFPRVLGTALFSEATLFAADALVASLVEAFGAWRWYRGTPKRRAARLAKRAALHSLRGAAALVAVACGNAVGSTSPISRGLCMFVCAQATSMLTNAYMSGVLERLTPELPDIKRTPGSDDAAVESLQGPHPTDAPQEASDRTAVGEGVSEAVGGALARLGAETVITSEEEEEESTNAVAEPPVPAPQEGSRPLAPMGMRAGPRLPSRPGRSGGARRTDTNESTASSTGNGTNSVAPVGPPTPQFREARHTETGEELLVNAEDSVAATAVETDTDPDRQLAADVAASAICSALLWNDGYVGVSPASLS